MLGTGWTVTPGACISRMKALMPRCFSSWFVRASTIILSARCAFEVQIFCPWIT